MALAMSAGAACGDSDGDRTAAPGSLPASGPDGGDHAGADSAGQPTATLAFPAERPASTVIVAHVAGPSIVARSSPDGGGEVVVELTNPTPVGGPLAFQLVDAEIDGAPDWLEVQLPIRPNGSTGWIPRAEVELSRNPFLIEIDTGDHRLDVFREGVPWISTRVAIGTGETPTPIGRFYIIELLEPPVPGGPYGSFAFGLSGFSETLTTFAGGDGVIGIHGTNDPASLGSDVSHGCIRVGNQTIEAMAGVIPLGTPVVIRT